MSELTETMDTEFLFAVRQASVEQLRADLVRHAREDGAARRGRSVLICYLRDGNCPHDKRSA
jgi:hypothetical protein